MTNIVNILSLLTFNITQQFIGNIGQKNITLIPLCSQKNVSAKRIYLYHDGFSFNSTDDISFDFNSVNSLQNQQNCSCSIESNVNYTIYIHRLHSILTENSALWLQPENDKKNQKTNILLTNAFNSSWVLNTKKYQVNQSLDSEIYFEDMDGYSQFILLIKGYKGTVQVNCTHIIHTIKKRQNVAEEKKNIMDNSLMVGIILSALGISFMVMTIFIIFIRRNKSDRSNRQRIDSVKRMSDFETVDKKGSINDVGKDRYITSPGDDMYEEVSKHGDDEVFAGEESYEFWEITDETNTCDTETQKAETIEPKLPTKPPPLKRESIPASISEDTTGDNRYFITETNPDKKIENTLKESAKLKMRLSQIQHPVNDNKQTIDIAGDYDDYDHIPNPNYTPRNSYIQDKADTKHIYHVTTEEPSELDSDLETEDIVSNTMHPNIGNKVHYRNDNTVHYSNDLGAISLTPHPTMQLRDDLEMQLLQAQDTINSLYQGVSQTSKESVSNKRTQTKTNESGKNYGQLTESQRPPDNGKTEEHLYSNSDQKMKDGTNMEETIHSVNTKQENMGIKRNVTLQEDLSSCRLKSDHDLLESPNDLYSNSDQIIKDLKHRKDNRLKSNEYINNRGETLKPEVTSSKKTVPKQAGLTEYRGKSEANVTEDIKGNTSHIKSDTLILKQQVCFDDVVKELTGKCQSPLIDYGIEELIIMKNDLYESLDCE